MPTWVARAEAAYKVGDYQDVRWHGPALPVHHDPVGANLGWHARKPPTKVGDYQAFADMEGRYLSTMTR